MGSILLHGQNAQGKTNLLEAIYYLATSRSAQADQDSQLINWDAAESGDSVVVGRLIAQVSTQSGSRHIEIRLIHEQGLSLRDGQRSFRRQALVDRRKVRLMDLLGNLRVVMFLPQDMQIVTGSPSERRRYLDITLCQIDPVYCRTLSSYNKTVEQRNALLRQIGEGTSSQELLPVYSEKLIELGSRIFARRSIFLGELAREAQRVHYEELTKGAESIRLRYLPRLQENGSGGRSSVGPLIALSEWLHENQADHQSIQAKFSAALETARATDISRGATSVGPHRDDWRFWINGRDLSRYGSRGQQRSAILALKMAEINWMNAATGESPILLLDEVLAELDEHRREMLLSYVLKSSQALLTATDPAMFTAGFMERSTSMTVSNGRVQYDDN